MNRKYPQTPHLPWSNGIDEKDIVLADASIFADRKIVVTEKYDGEHITIGNNSCYLSSRQLNPAFDEDLLKTLPPLQAKIPDGYALQGEYMRFTHDIHYDQLTSYLLFYFINNAEGMLSWEDTRSWLCSRHLTVARVFYRGMFSEGKLKELSAVCDADPSVEGYVIRSADPFPFEDMRLHVAKYVRKGFRQIRIKSAVGVKRNSLISK